MENYLNISPQVWYLSIDESMDISEARTCLDILSDHEKKRYERFRFERDRVLFLLSHAMLRVVLSQYAEIAPQDWLFESSQSGRPELTGSCANTRLRFNLTHTRGMAACIVTENVDCGIDLEQLQRQSSMTGIAEKMFSSAENLTLQQVAATDKSCLFYSFWTLREAYLKACGTGLTVPTRNFSFDLSNRENITVSFSEGINDCAEHWHFSLYSPTEKTLLATALRSMAVPAISYHAFSREQLLALI